MTQLEEKLLTFIGMLDAENERLSFYCHSKEAQEMLDGMIMTKVREVREQSSLKTIEKMLNVGIKPKIDHEKSLIEIIDEIIGNNSDYEYDDELDDPLDEEDDE